jgi:predicted porin
MIKKILPAMIGAALVGGMAPAVADVTVFGHIDTSVDYVDRGDSRTNMECNTCSIGFKGSEDLGNGLKAIFKIDFQYDTTERNRGNIDQDKAVHKAVADVTISTTGGPTTPNVTNVDIIDGGFTAVTDVNHKGSNGGSSSSIIDRDQWLGLAGNFGQVRFGTISTIYKSHGAMIDPLYRTSVQARGIGLQSGLHKGAGESGQGRAEDTFRYDSPSWNGLKVGATYTMQTDDSDNSTDTPWGAGIEYKNGPFLVFADYITSDNGGDDDAYKLGGKWTFGNYSLYGQYEFDGGLISSTGGTFGVNSQGAGNKGDSADVWEIGGTGTWGNNMLVAAYGQQDKTSGANREDFIDEQRVNNESDQWEIVGVHSMSKRTKIYAGYAAISPDSGSNLDIVTLGMKHLF